MNFLISLYLFQKLHTEIFQLKLFFNFKNKDFKILSNGIEIDKININVKIKNYQ